VARILIVDGDPASRDPVQRAIAQEGLDVVVAGDPEAAWEAFLAFSPRLALLGRGLDRAQVEKLIVRMRRADPSIVFASPAPPWPEMARRLRVQLGAPAPREVPPAPAPSPGTARVLSRPPLESGPLAFGTLADLLARLWRSAADGIVSIAGSGGTDRVFVLRGAPVAVRLAGREESPDAAAALAALCATATGTFSYHPGSGFAPEVRAGRIPALAPLLAGLRLAADEPSFVEALLPSSDARPRRSAASGAVLRELALSPDDAATAAAADGNTPVHVLLRGRGRPASLVWFLLRCGGAELAAPGPEAEAGAGTAATPLEMEPPSPA
jgi:hypothetical protein